MQLSPHKSSSNAATGIFFPKLECWNPLTDVATVAAEVNKQRVLCRVSLQLLRDQFGASDDAPMQLVARHRTVIQDAARRLIEKRSYESDGSVEIRQRDLKDQC